MPRFERRKEDRPKEILAAAFREFSDKGYAGARLDDVAKAAGVSKGLVYRYFETKEDLFKAVVRDVLTPRFDALSSAVEAHDGSCAGFLRGPFLEFATQAVNSPIKNVLRLLIAEGPAHPDLTRFYHEEFIARAMGLVRSLLERAETSGEFRPTDMARFPQLVVAPVVMSMIWSLLFERYETIDTRAMLARHVENLIAALSGENS